MLEQLITSAKKLFDNSNFGYFPHQPNFQNIEYKHENWLHNKFENEMDQYCKKRRFNFNLKIISDHDVSIRNYLESINNLIEIRSKSDLPQEQFSNDKLSYYKMQEVGGIIGVKNNLTHELTYTPPNPKHICCANIIIPNRNILKNYETIIEWHTHPGWTKPSNEDLNGFNKLLKLKLHQNILFVIYTPGINKSTWYKPTFRKIK